MSLLARLAAIRARNLARYSPDSRAQLAAAVASYNWRWRGWMMTAIVVGAVAQTTPLPFRIAGDVVCLTAITVSSIYVHRHNRRMKAALAALRASRRATDQQLTDQA